MPYSVVSNHPDCEGYAVVKTDNNEVMGCHKTQAQAEDQLTALMIESGWKKGHAWCAYFVHAMLNECGIVNTITGWSPTAYNRKDVIFDGGKFLKSFADGDVLVMTLSYTSMSNTKRYKGIAHTGIVDKIGKYSVRTIEGNTNEQGMRDSRTRDGVYYKIRPLSKNLHITRWKKQE